MHRILQGTTTFEAQLCTGCSAVGPWYFSNNLPSMCLSLLDQVVWRRRSGKGRQTESCQPACEEPANPEGLLALCDCVLTCMCVCLRDRNGSNTANMSYGLTHTDTHKTFNCQKKKSLPSSIVSNVFNVNLTL